MVEAAKYPFVWYPWIQSHWYHQITWNDGGVFLLISDVFMHSELTELCMVSDYIECIFIKIMHNDLSYVIGVMYRPPNSNIVMFNKKLNDILSQISHMPCYKIGDYNIDLQKHDNHLQTEQFLDVMHSNSSIPVIYKPTRETNNTATLIDNIFTNNYCVDDLLLQGLFIANISDHHAIFHIRDKYILVPEPFFFRKQALDERLHHNVLYCTMYCTEIYCTEPRFTNGFSIAIQIRWNFRFTLISILIK